MIRLSKCHHILVISSFSMFASALITLAESPFSGAAPASKLSPDVSQTAPDRLTLELITAWEAVRDRKDAGALAAAARVFRSVQKDNDPGAAYQGEAGLAALAAIEDGGGFQEATLLYPVPSHPMLGKFNILSPEKSGPWGFVDRNGKLVIPATWDWAANFSEGLASVKLSGKWGCIDRSGKLVIPATWDDIYGFHEGFAEVKQGEKRGLVDRNGKLVIPPTRENIGPPTEGLIPVKEGGKWGCMDRSGKLVIPATWNDPILFSEGLAAVYRSASSEFENRFSGAYINRTGKLVIPPTWLVAGSFKEGLAPVKQLNKFGFIDRGGKVVIPPTWERADGFTEGLAAVKQFGKFGFIDRSGKLVIQPSWDSVLSSGFHEGLAGVERDGKYGFIDRSGSVVIPVIWDEATSCTNGLIKVQEKINETPQGTDERGNDLFPGRMLYLDKKGLIVWSSDGKGIGQHAARTR